MGLTKVTAKVSSFGNGKKFYEAVFLVDTGATDSMVAGPELEKIGVKKEGKMSYELADGSRFAVSPPTPILRIKLRRATADKIRSSLRLYICA
jgi:hypothetical protein